MLAFTFALAIVTGVLFGMVPALQMSRPDLHEELKGGAGSSVSPGQRRRFTSNALVVAEIALSLILLVSAGLLLKDFARLRSLDIGVRREGVWTAAVQLPEAGYKTDRQQYDFSQALARASAAHRPAPMRWPLSDRLPLEGGSNYYVKLRGQSGRDEQPAGGSAYGVTRVFSRAGCAAASGAHLHGDPISRRRWPPSNR